MPHGFRHQPATPPASRRRTLAVLWALSLTLLLSTVTWAQELTAYQSKAYTVHTNLPREIAADYGRHMDAVYAEYARRFAGFGKVAPKRMDLYLFRSQKQYITFMASHGIDAQNSGGLFVMKSGINGLVTWVEDRPRYEALAVLQHEGFHQFAHHHIGENLPIWVHEGLAQYFEDGILIDDRMHVGVPNAYRGALVKKAINENYAVDFDRLLNISSQEWHTTLTGVPDVAALFYAQSWSMCYFLVHGDNGRYREAFSKYLRLIAEDKTPREAFAAAFRTSNTNAFRKRWEGFVKDMEPDPVNVAVFRLEFLGRGLNWMAENNLPMPNSIDDLKHALQRRGFYMTRGTHGITFKLDSADDEVFTYATPEGRSHDFRLLSPARKQDPPRIVASRLDPRPMLIWRVNADGDLEPAIAWD